MIYEVNIRARVESNLAKNKFENQVVIALHNTDTQYSKFDGVDANLEVMDYELTEAVELCPNCDILLLEKESDDDKNITKYSICEECGYKSLTNSQ